MTAGDPWADLPSNPLHGTLAARAAGSPGLWYAIDPGGRRHLLISLDRPEPRATLFTTRGVTAVVDQLDPGGQGPELWIDVACTDPSINDTFTVLADQLAAALEDADDRKATVTDTLERWRWFWSNRPGPLTDEEALGLFAELWFLYRWLTLPHAIKWWRGPLGDRHDFVHPAASVEVKATRLRTDGAPTHRITHIDQLDDPPTGQLYLFSLTASVDQLATNTLAGLIEHLTGVVAGTPQAAIWRDLLEAANWHPAHAGRYRTPFRVTSEELYVVDHRFPRLTRPSLVGGEPPSGVEGISYSANLAAAVECRVATEPTPPELAPLLGST